MTDPLIIAGAGATVLGSKDLLNKLLGPTAEYIGEKTLGLVKKCDINLDNIFTKAIRKLGNRIDEKGQINPRLLKLIIYDGGFIEDDLAQEYYAGVLAASRSNDELDDRGVTFLTMVKRLSIYQIRSHNLYYSIFVELFKNSDQLITNSKQRIAMTTFIPISDYKASMNIGPNQNTSVLIPHVLYGLRREALIDSFSYSIKDGFKKQGYGKGIKIVPSALGMELFLWVNGYNNISVNEPFYNKNNFAFETSNYVKLPEQAFAIEE